MTTAAAAQVEALLAEARRARTAGDLVECRQALARADELCATLDPGHPLRHTVAWRSSKALFDLDEPLQALHAVRDVLASDAPFEHYPAGLNAAVPLANAVWDRHGYGEPGVERLWQCYTSAHLHAGDPFLAGMGDVQRAWQIGCSGRLDELEALLERYAALDPRRFGDGPHRHPRAEDAPTSVFWVQMDLARTALRAAVWGREDRLARVALELYEDALAEAGVERLQEYWFIEPAARAALQLGWSGHGELVDAWFGLAAALEHERAPLHRRLAQGAEHMRNARHDGAVRSFVEAAATADQLQAGPEWAIDARLEAIGAARAADLVEPAGFLQQAMALVERDSVRVFSAPIAALLG